MKSLFLDLSDGAKSFFQIRGVSLIIELFIANCERSHSTENSTGVILVVGSLEQKLTMSEPRSESWQCAVHPAFIQKHRRCVRLMNSVSRWSIIGDTRRPSAAPHCHKQNQSQEKVKAWCESRETDKWTFYWLIHPCDFPQSPADRSPVVLYGLLNTAVRRWVCRVTQRWRVIYRQTPAAKDRLFVPTSERAVARQYHLEVLYMCF